ncbi:perlucin-like protein [Ptychodera flava]|uniref:perlucin-like protein n=1 Tax=Ptychodera flava TaxID=63121 RepID=UPI00396A63DF
MKIPSACLVTLLVLSAHLLVCLCCDDGWSEYNGHCYYFEEDKMGFDDAQCACNANGAYLVKLDDQDESDFVTGTMMSDSTWIGTRRGIVDSGCSKWFMIHDMSEVPFTNWSPDEPNNDGDENCVEIRTSDYLWNDLSCTHGMKSVCEKE